MLTQVLLKRTVLLTDHTTDEAFRGRTIGAVVEVNG
jgi:hypothetical protein